jgi:RNAse (barnase) inhibitor barstar
MDVHSLFRTAAPYLHLWSASPSDAYEFARSIQQAPGRQAIVRLIRGAKAKTADRLFDEFGAALQFPDYFGENWDALFDCLCDLEWLAGDAYLLFITDGELVLEREPKEFKNLMEVLANAAEEWAKAEDSQGVARPFHFVLQCSAEREAHLEARLRETGHKFEVLTADHRQS